MQRVKHINGCARTVVKLSPARVRRYLDRECMRRLGISAGCMLRKYRRGTLKDAGRVADLIVWSDALPKDDPIFEAS